jgi:hypothetical protein
MNSFRRADMREIEFRGKRRDNGEWAYGDLTHLAYGIAAINDDIVVDDKTVGQYTGLKDGTFGPGRRMRNHGL